MQIHKNRLAIGTVQFGTNYGIANTAGQLSLQEGAAIVKYAFENGVDTLDTAIVYGESEKRLGEIGIEGWKVISKLPVLPDDCVDVAAWVEASVMASLDRLGVGKLYALLLHNSKQLSEQEGPEIYRTLERLKQQGYIQKTGISIYDPDELDILCATYTFDLLQAPFNLVDRRLSESGWLQKLTQMGVEVHIRSVFMQGLLLMPTGKRPAFFNRWETLWQTWDNWLSENAVTPVQACLSFVMSQPGIERIIVGVDSLEQFIEILAASQLPPVVPPASLMSTDLNLINPFLWNKV